MVTIDQIEKGVGAYLDKEIMPQLDENGFQKVIIGTALGLGIRRAKNQAASYLAHPAVKMLGIADENGNIDLETVSDELKKNIKPEGFTVDVPMLGTLRFRKEDVDSLKNYILGGNGRG